MPPVGRTGPDQPVSDPAVVAARLRQVREAVDQATKDAGRNDTVRLIAISKTHPWQLLAAAVDAGATDLGENRVAELVVKMDHPDPDGHLDGLAWHFVGQLQSRKARDVVARDVLVHSVDRTSLVDALQRRAATADTIQQVLVQVNVGDDPAKGGCDLREVDSLVAYACEQRNLEVRGLMTMPPQVRPTAASQQGSPIDPAQAARPHFARLRQVRDRLVRQWPGITELSMGMSADMTSAVAEGATMVRIGTGVFGPRRAGPWRGPRQRGDTPRKGVR